MRDHLTIGVFKNIGSQRALIEASCAKGRIILFLHDCQENRSLLQTLAPNSPLSPCWISLEKLMEPNVLYQAIQEVEDFPLEGVELLTDLSDEKWLNQFRSIFKLSVLKKQVQSQREDVAPFENSFLRFQNVLQNLDLLWNLPDFRKWRNLFKGKPAVVFGAGPSLNDQLPWISSMRDHALWIAADTLAKPFEKAQLAPDIFCTIERGEEISNLISEQHEWSKTFLVGPTTVDRKTFENFKGPRLSFLAPYGWNSALPIAKPIVPYGHSCVGLAIQLAISLGCSPIILAGVDLCYAAGGESHWSEVPYLSSAQFKMQNAAQKQKPIYRINRQGKEVMSHLYWNLFHYEFEEMMKSASDTSFFHLSEEGLPFESAPFMSKASFLQMTAPAVGSSYKILKDHLYWLNVEDQQNQIQLWKDRIPLLLEEILDCQKVLSDRESFIVRLQSLRAASPLLQSLLAQDLNSLNWDNHKIQSSIQKIVLSLQQSWNFLIPKTSL